MVSKIGDSAYLKKIGLLLSSSALGQMIPFIFIPVLSRIYTPVQFADFGFFLLAVGILSTFGTLKLDQAILMPSSIKEASEIAQSIISLLIIVSIIGFFLIYYISNWNWILSLACAVTGFTTGMSIILIQLSNRMNFSKVIANHKLVLGGSVSGFQVGFSGLWYGMIIGKAFGDLLSLIPYIKVFSRILPYAKKINYIDLWKQYKSFPIYVLPYTLLLLISNRLPLVYFSSIGKTDFSGEYEAIFRIGFALITLVGQVVYFTFSKELVDRLQKKQAISAFHWKHMQIFFKYGLLPSVPISVLFYLFLPDLLGDGWQNTGKIFLIISPYLVSMLFVQPYVYYFNYANKQHVLLIIESVGTVLKMAALVIGVVWSEIMGLVGFSIIGTLIYCWLGYYIHVQFKKLDMELEISKT